LTPRELVRAIDQVEALIARCMRGQGFEYVAADYNLSAADQAAYNRTLFGGNPGESFAVALEGENFSCTDGCTRGAIGRVFTEDQMQASYYNPKDALISQDPRMKKALRKYAAEMRTLGLDYNHPDEVEPDIRECLAALIANGTLRVEDMTPKQREACEHLQAYERRVAAIDLRLAEEFFEPVEAAIEKELFAREVK